MTRNDIIRIAKEAGYKHPDVGGDAEDFTYFDFEHLAALVAEAENEACAEIAAWILKMPENDVSTAIRARGQHD